jgi:PAS domain-containing protein
MYQQSKLNSNTAVIHYEAGVERETKENELIILVRSSCSEIETDSELDVLLHDFATDLVKRRLIRKVEFFRAMDSGLAGIVDANSIQNYSRVRNWKFLASCRDAIVKVNTKVTTFTARLLVGLKPLKVLLLRPHQTFTRLARTIADKPRSLREERCERENNLRQLLTTSFDAIVVTNNDGRFVMANSIALDLFGISERNLTMFTIAAFLPQRQFVELHGNGGHFMNCKEREGKCEIKPLNGRLLVAQYTFVANIAPARSLYRFRDFTPSKLTDLDCGARELTSQRRRHWAIQPTSGASVTNLIQSS